MPVNLKVYDIGGIKPEGAHTVRAIQPEHFARIMRLPQAERADLLDFLGATPVGDRQIDALIIQVRHQSKRATIEAEAAASGPPPA